MTKKEKLLTLEAMRDDSVARMDKTVKCSLREYEKGRVDALNDAIAVLKNGEDGNAFRKVYLGKGGLK